MEKHPLKSRGFNPALEYNLHDWWRLKGHFVCDFGQDVTHSASPLAYKTSHLREMMWADETEAKPH
jgi:hypothetical protein